MTRVADGSAGEIEELKAALLALQQDEQAKADALAAANQTLTALRVQIEQAKADAAANTDSSDIDLRLAAMQTQMDGALLALTAKKNEAAEASAKTGEAEAALASAVAAVPQPTNPGSASGTNHTAVIVVIAIGLVLVVAIIAFVVVRRQSNDNAIPTTVMMNSAMAAKPAYESGAQPSAVNTPMSYDNPMYSSMA